ncbi:GntR family transcriptional regulator [Embleya sp. NPDC001921]
MAIERRSLREQIRDELVRRLARGEFRPGSVVDEAALALEFGVSRTPLREALIALVGEGVLRSGRHRGFEFAPISNREFTELVEIVAELEAYALRSSDPERLAEIAGRLLGLADEFPQQVAEYGLIAERDREWHDLLISACANRRLVGLIASVKTDLRRYESLMVPDDRPIAREHEEHREIARRLIAKDIPGAVTALRANWLNSSTRMLAEASPTRTEPN